MLCLFAFWARSTQKVETLTPQSARLLVSHQLLLLKPQVDAYYKNHFTSTFLRFHNHKLQKYSHIEHSCDPCDHQLQSTNNIG